MKLMQCPKGHFYNAEISEQCPVCCGEGTNAVPSSQVWEDHGTFSDDDSPTCPMFGDWAPVVGWLVCVEGKTRGRDYRLHAERNFVGRSGAMDVSVYEDEKIAMQNHCSVIFEPKNREFLLAPNAETITYFKGALLEHAVTLSIHDTFTIGDTTLEFIPYCGKESLW